MGECKKKLNPFILVRDWLGSSEPRATGSRLDAERRALLQTRRRILEKLSARLRNSNHGCN